MQTQTFYSQFGEDRILSTLFRNKNSGLAVEVGGYDGVSLSNTLYFEKLGWRTIVVEPIPYLAEKIRSNRTATVLEYAAGDSEGEVEFTVVAGIEELSTAHLSDAHKQRALSEGGSLKKIVVQMRTLDSMLGECSVEKIDFVTIDVEGLELQVLRGFSLRRWQPDVVIVEDNSLGKDPLVMDYLATQSYIPFLSTGCNEWYAPADTPRTEIQAMMKSYPMRRRFLKLARWIKRFVPSFLKDRVKAIVVKDGGTIIIEN